MGVMQMKLGSSYRVQVSRVQVSRVHVSRIVLTPSAAARMVVEQSLGGSAPEVGTHSSFLLRTTRNSRRISPCTHFFPDDADCSLLHPHHRCYALLSSALS